MRHRPVTIAVFAGAVALLAGSVPHLGAQRGGMFFGSIDDPAIAYSTAPNDNIVVDVNGRLDAGTLTLSFQGRAGYLQSALDAFGLSADSQMLVFSPTSFQARRINPANPRALFLNESVALGFVRGGDLIEVAAQDRQQGTVFYTLEQTPVAAPRFKRVNTCLGCHLSRDTLGVPGLLMFSTTPPADARGFSTALTTDHRSPLNERWGGWYVTGSSGSAAHMGNNAPGLDGRQSREIATVDGLFDMDAYRASTSDIASLMVLSHQVHMTNLLTRAGWEARASDPTLHPPFVAAPGEDARIDAQMRDVAVEVVDYLLFVDEALLTSPVRGTSGFAERFSKEGKKDSKGRAFHQLDLNRRLLRYPCSYLIDSPAFIALPPRIKNAIYARMWQVLSGAEQGPRYRSALSLGDRQAVVDILRETHSDLPAFFSGAIR